jgi:hypothetical protein
MLWKLYQKSERGGRGEEGGEKREERRARRELGGERREGRREERRGEGGECDKIQTSKMRKFERELAKNTKFKI